MSQAVTNALKKAERKGEEKAMKKVKKAAQQAVNEARPAILQEGMLEGERNIFLHLISKNYIKKFGSLSEELKEKISEQANENLEIILDAIPDLHNEQEIIGFLVN